MTSVINVALVKSPFLALALPEMVSRTGDAFLIVRELSVRSMSLYSWIDFHLQNPHLTLGGLHYKQNI